MKQMAKLIFTPLVVVVFAVRLIASLLMVSSLMVNVAGAQESDEDSIKNLVQQEVERLLNTEGVLDAAIDKGIERFILKQKAASEQARDQEQQALAGNMRAVDPQRDHIFGNPEAPITLVEYSDFECPYCKRFHPMVVQLMENNPDKIRWVYRHFPLGFHNPGAQKQAEASECVAELDGNDAFWAYSDFIYQRTKAGGNGFPLENLRPLAEEIGVDGNAFDECLMSGRMTARVQEDLENGAQSGVKGTPASFLLNRDGEVRFVSGALPVENLQAVVDELLR